MLLATNADAVRLLIQRYEAVNFKGADRQTFEPIARPGMRRDPNTRGPLSEDETDYLFEYLKNMG